MSSYRLSISAFLFLVVVFSGCDSKNPYDTGPAYDEAGNLAKDSLLIVEYLKTAEIDSLYRIYDPSGVVIIVQEEGTGSRPKGGNIIYTNYTGSLMSDGSVFDTNDEQVAVNNDLYKEGIVYDIFDFVLYSQGQDRVITGWNIAYSRLRSGSKAQLIIPSTWAYRDAGNAGDKVPPNSVLLFDVEFKGMD